jgi:hypothetical protein
VQSKTTSKVAKGKVKIEKKALGKKAKKETK